MPSRISWWNIFQPSLAGIARLSMRVFDCLAHQLGLAQQAHQAQGRHRADVHLLSSLLLPVVQGWLILDVIRVASANYAWRPGKSAVLLTARAGQRGLHCWNQKQADPPPLGAGLQIALVLRVALGPSVLLFPISLCLARQRLDRCSRFLRSLVMTFSRACFQVRHLIDRLALISPVSY